ncbi:esterase family protein [Mucilaginibacter celer]|uniref:Esterase n=1 Tax=Mucilaginibacter celer TaxID=2305508 RepID=A0A494VIG4_9SPHI|nr:alpha/beta hydrolase-fold protein [Mucilaginibacter celer]AYL94676.1 esterase [Mucilaginibacter celer]
MKREYHKWFSPFLQRNMEMLVFGHSGASVLFFPTRTARFYDYEDWKVIEALRPKIEAGYLQIYCVDSIDRESFYNEYSHPHHRIERHLQYEQYILQEVVPFMKKNNPGTALISAGCSMGAYHAVTTAFKHPHLFKKVVGMSGRYDVTQSMGSFRDLLDGYRDENVYFNMPNQFMPNLGNPDIITALKKLDIIIVIGEEDAFLADNKYLCSILAAKGIPNHLYIWHEEAHRARYWRKMVQIYF